MRSSGYRILEVRLILGESMTKNYVVVGGSSGIGLGIVKQLASRGDQVVVYSRTIGGLEGVANVTHVVADVTHGDFDGSDLPESIDGLVYCPGSLNLKSFKSLKPEVFREDFEVNVVGAVKVIQAALPALKKSGNSSVVLFSTVAVEGLTRTLAAELSPATRVNCVAPALTDTPLTKRFFSSEEKIAAMGEKYPLQRTGTIDDFVGVTDFLLGESSGWVTGQVIGVDGGMSTLRK
jgi:NAD(P)-dependent dehydrogenase (short-subunit alcohol dehydrogenase family)